MMAHNCTSFVVMRDLGVDSAFAFDHNFEEAGYTGCRRNSTP